MSAARSQKSGDRISDAIRWLVAMLAASFWLLTPGHAQTNVIAIPLADIGQVPEAGVAVNVQLTGPFPRIVGGATNISHSAQTHYTDVTGTATFTNLPWGSYLCVIPSDNVRFSFAVQTNTLGAANVAALTGYTNQPPAGWPYYTAWQVDALIAGVSGGTGGGTPLAAGTGVTLNYANGTNTVSVTTNTYDAYGTAAALPVNALAVTNGAINVNLGYGFTLAANGPFPPLVTLASTFGTSPYTNTLGSIAGKVVFQDSQGNPLSTILSNVTAQTFSGTFNGFIGSMTNLNSIYGGSYNAGSLVGMQVNAGSTLTVSNGATLAITGTGTATGITPGMTGSQPTNGNLTGYASLPTNIVASHAEVFSASNTIVGQMPSTNGFVTASVTNGLATTNYVLTVGANATNYANTVLAALQATNAATTNSLVTLDLATRALIPTTAAQIGGVTNRQITGLANQYDLRLFGAPVNGIALTNCTIAAGSSNMFAPSGEFNGSSVGQWVTIYRVNTNYQNLTCQIYSVPNPSNAVLNTTAAIGRTNTLAFAGSDDSAALQAGINYVATNGGGWIVIPPCWYSNNNAHGIVCLATNIGDLGNIGQHHNAQFWPPVGQKNGAQTLPLIGFLGAFPVVPGGSGSADYLPYFYGSTVVDFASTPPTSTNLARLFDFSDYTSGLTAPSITGYTNYYSFYDPEFKNLNFITCFNDGLRNIDLSGADSGGRWIDSMLRAGFSAIALTNTFTYTNNEWGLMMGSLFNENMGMVENATIAGYANGLDLPLGGRVSSLYICNAFNGLTATNGDGLSSCDLSWINAVNCKYIFGRITQSGVTVNGDILLQNVLSTAQNAQIGGFSTSLADGSGYNLYFTGHCTGGAQPTALPSYSQVYYTPQYGYPGYLTPLYFSGQKTLDNRDAVDNIVYLMQSDPGASMGWYNAQIATGASSPAAGVPYGNYGLTWGWNNTYGGSPMMALNTNASLTVGSNITAASFIGGGASLSNLNAGQLTAGTVPLAALPAAVLTNNTPSATTLNGSLSATSISSGGNITSTGGQFTGNGGSITNVQATNLVGVVPQASIPYAAPLGIYFTSPYTNSVSYYVPPPYSGANSSTINSYQCFCPAGFSGHITNCIICQTVNNLGVGTNISVWVYTGPSQGTLLGTLNGAATANQITNCACSFTISNPTNIWCVGLSNNTPSGFGPSLHASAFLQTSP